MPLSDLWPLLGRRRYCDRTSVSFTHLLWEKPGGFRWFVSKEQEPRGASGFLLGEQYSHFVAFIGGARGSAFV